MKPRWMLAWRSFWVRCTWNEGERGVNQADVGVGSLASLRRNACGELAAAAAGMDVDGATGGMAKVEMMRK